MDYLFTFKYGGRRSQQLLPKWNFSQRGDVLLWEDPDTKLAITANIVLYPTGVREWVLMFKNNGTEPTPIIEDVWAACTRLDADGWGQSAKLHLLNGSLSQEDDWLPFTVDMKPGSMYKLSPTDGRSSCGACPFFNLEWGGGGIITAIGWTGQWRAEVAWGTKTEIRAGMERMHLSLLPGESVRTPRIMQLDWEGDIQDAYNRFRRTMLNHILPRVGDATVVAPIAHLSTAAFEWNCSTQDDVLSHLEAVKDLGFETLWLDAYYFNGGFPRGMGNCGPTPDDIVDEERYPLGLGYLGGRAHGAGMQWLVWMCFEAAAPGTWLDREHPDWLLSAAEREYKLVNLGLPEVQEYMTNYLISAVRAWALDWLRIDCCPGPLPYWKVADSPDRVGMTEIRWVEGLYRILDGVLAVCPHLKIDNCDGGGRRIDIEMCRRTTPLWRTDFSTPVMEHGDFERGAVLTQAMIAGLSRYVPYNSCGAFHEDPYFFRSAFNGGVGVLEDCRLEFYDRESMSLAIEEAKRIRKYFAGDLYILTPVNLDLDGWHAFQYHLPEEDSGIILVFRREACREGTFVLDLRGIDLKRPYEVRFSSSYDMLTSRSMDGDELAHMVVGVTRQRRSLLIEYRS